MELVRYVANPKDRTKLKGITVFHRNPLI